MTDKQSYTIDRERWSRLSVFEQLGNIGSEVGRTLKLKRKGRDYEPALTRALDLFDATVTDMLSTHPHRAKEVLRAKECFLDALFIKDDPGIEAYFTQYAIAARNQQIALQK
jgi:predicted secreted Zn-dependent protease